MSMFSSILGKLGMNNDDTEQDVYKFEPKPAPVVETVAPVVSAVSAPAAASVATASTAQSTPAPAAVTSVTEVDVLGKLEGLAASSAEKLNWKVSIVDLLKLLALDSSLTARKELAAELDCPDEKMADSAQMNMWLHKTVLQKLAQNGGNIPQDLLD